MYVVYNNVQSKEVIDVYQQPMTDVYTLKNVKVISTLAGIPQLHLFRGFYSVHVRVISTLPGYILSVKDVSIMAQLADLN